MKISEGRSETFPQKALLGTPGRGSEVGHAETVRKEPGQHQGAPDGVSNDELCSSISVEWGELNHLEVRSVLSGPS